ncbi:hypothetical protein H6G36_13825 [Anabaena minutissima FACHB-250]|nr:hypothetical protein [Anabaena minutissima FACHB-250]
MFQKIWDFEGTGDKSSQKSKLKNFWGLGTGDWEEFTQHRLNAPLPLTALPTPHSARAKRPATANSTQHSPLPTPHSPLPTQHSALSTLNS